jgi:hypothetical protein
LESESQETVTPATAPVAKVNLEKLRGNISADAETKRLRQALELQRERILSERTASPHRRSALAAALIDIEEKLSELAAFFRLRLVLPLVGAEICADPRANLRIT